MSSLTIAKENAERRDVNGDVMHRQRVGQWNLRITSIYQFMHCTDNSGKQIGTIIMMKLQLHFFIIIFKKHHLGRRGMVSFKRTQNDTE